MSIYICFPKSKCDYSLQIIIVDVYEAEACLSERILLSDGRERVLPLKTVVYFLRKVAFFDP